MSQPNPFKLSVRPSTRTGTVIKLTVSAFEEHVRNIDGFRLSFSKSEDSDPIVIAVQTVRDGLWTEVKGDSIKQLGKPLYDELKKNAPHLDKFGLTGELFINVDDVTEDIGNQYSKSLTEIIESNNPRLNESMFRAYYMPFFTLQPSEISDPEYHEKYLAAIRRWKIEVAGMSNDVDVVDGAGNVLFTVPSLSMRADINYVGKTPIQSINEEFEHIGELRPADAEVYLETELTRALDMDVAAQRKGLNDAIQMINKIRLYYGRGPLFNGDGQNETSKPQQATSSASEDFDDSDFVDF